MAAVAQAPQILTRTGQDDLAAIASTVGSLLADKRGLDAIGFAVAANRRSPSVELERLIVGWRMDAFAAIQHGPGRTDWPPTFSDPFPGVSGLPSIPAAALTSDILGGAILHHGALWVRGLISRVQAEAFRRNIDQACAARDAYNGGHADPDGGAWYSPLSGARGAPENRGWVEEGDGVQTTDSPRIFFELTELFERHGLTGLIGGFLGERPAMSVKKSTLRRVHPNAGSDWHQDGLFLGENIRSVNVWLGLTDCGQDAPGLELVGRRIPYVLQSGSHGPIFDWAVGPGLVEMLAQAGAPVLSPVFAAGDAVLFDHLMLHRTGVRPGMTGSRWAIESWFFAPSVYPLEQLPVVI